jgi:hypothetical protein
MGRKWPLSLRGCSPCRIRNTPIASGLHQRLLLGGHPGSTGISHGKMAALNEGGEEVQSSRT